MNRWFDDLPVIGKYVPGKITLSFLMLIFSVVLVLVLRGYDRAICVIAMFFSFTGDIALNYKRDHSKQSKSDFMIGGIAFMFAHVYYFAAYYIKIKSFGYALCNHGSTFAIVLLVTVTILFLLKSILDQKKSKLMWFGLLYLWLTGIDYFAIFSFAYSFRFTFQSIVFLGALMFFTSDLIIGMEKFLGVKSKLLRELVWWLYPIGQIIIIAIA